MKGMRFGVVLALSLISMAVIAAGVTRGFSANATALNFYFNEDPSVYTYTGSTISANATVQISIVEEGTFIPGVHTHPSWTISITGPNPNNPQQIITVASVTFTHPGPYTNSNVGITLPIGPGQFTYTASLTGGDGSASSASDTATIPLELAISSGKTTLCAGGISSAPHQANITATLTSNGNPVSGKSVTFSVTSSNPTYPASISSTSASTNSAGNAVVTLTSGRKINTTATVTATFGNLLATTSAVTMSKQSASWAITPQELVADGTSTAAISVTFTFDGQPVSGHQVSWRIESVLDANGTVVYRANPPYGSYTGYGSIAGVTSTSTDMGVVTATYTAGTNPGTIEFAVLDNTIVENSPGLFTSGSSKATTAKYKVTLLKASNNITMRDDYYGTTQDDILYAAHFNVIGDYVVDPVAHSQTAEIINGSFASNVRISAYPSTASTAGFTWRYTTTITKGSTTIATATSNHSGTADAHTITVGSNVGTYNIVHQLNIYLSGAWQSWLDTDSILYQIYNTPQSPEATPAIEVVDLACGTINGSANTEDGCSHALMTFVHGSMTYNPSVPTCPDPWVAYDINLEGQCADFGNVLTLFMRSIGISGTPELWYGGGGGVGQRWVLNPYGSSGTIFIPDGSIPNAGDWHFDYHVITKTPNGRYDSALDHTGSPNIVHWHPSYAIVNGTKTYPYVPSSPSLTFNTPTPTHSWTY